MVLIRNAKYRNIIVFVTIFIIGMLIVVYYKYSQPREIDYTYQGIKYQIGNLSSEIPVKIEIKGVYKKGFWGNPDLFDGEIIVDGKTLYGVGAFRSRNNIYSFSNEKMSLIQGDDFRGGIYDNDNMKDILIEVHELDSAGIETFSYNNGWLISAPCQNRKQAVYISNKIIQKIHKELLIK